MAPDPHIQPNPHRAQEERRRRGFYTDNNGRRVKKPLKHGFAKVVDDTVDQDVRESIHEKAVELRNLSLEGLSRAEAVVVKRHADTLQKELRKLLEPLKALQAKDYELVTRPDRSKVRLYSEISGLELRWRSGPEFSPDTSRTTVQRLTRGRDHFALVGAANSHANLWHNRALGASISVDLRDYLYQMAQDNGWSFRLNNNEGTSRFDVTMSSSSASLDILISPHRPLDPKSDFTGVVLTTTDGQSEKFQRLTMRSAASATINGRKLHEQLHAGNGNKTYIEDYYQRMTLDRDGSPRFNHRPITLYQSVYGLMTGELAFVEGVDGICRGFDARTRYALVDREQVAIVQDLVKRDLFFAERRRIAMDFVSKVPGFTMYLDEHSHNESRWGKGAVIYPVPDPKESTTQEWTPQLGYKKIVVNPSATFLNHRANGRYGQTFVQEDWENTLVIFHSTNKTSMASNRQGFYDWLKSQNDARPFDGTPEINLRDLGIEIFSSGIPKKIRAKMYSYLSEYQLDFSSEAMHAQEASQPRTPVADPDFNFETFINHETGGTVAIARPDDPPARISSR